MSLTLIAPVIVANSGEEVCVNITTKDFDNIFSFQTSIQWDTNIVEYIDLRNLIDDLEYGLDFYANTDEGYMIVNWFTQGDLSGPGLSISEEETLFTLCFNPIGQGGTCSPIEFVGTPAPFEGSDANGRVIGITPNNGKIFIANNALDINVNTIKASCQETENGSFTANISNGTPPYQISWNRVEAGMDVFNPIVINNQETVTNLGAGMYKISAVDAAVPPNTSSIEIEIGAPPILSLDLSQVHTTTPSPNGGTDGAIQVAAVGGTAPYTFEWFNGETGANIDKLSAGAYDLTITDANACTFIHTFELEDIITEIPCTGDSKQANQGGKFTPCDTTNFQSEEEAELLVVSRWGKIVYRTPISNKKAINRKDIEANLPLDIYYYIIRTAQENGQFSYERVF